MRRIGMLVSLAALAMPAAAAADGSSTTGSPAQQCRAERTKMGVAAFKATYGTNRNRSNAFGKCVSKRARANAAAEATAAKNAAKACKAEQADPNFAATHGGKTFDQFYGTNKNGKNAYGKCVSGQAKAEAQETEAAEVKADVNAAKACKAERKALGSTAFADKYGTNRNKRNAFGKCVSKRARAATS